MARKRAEPSPAPDESGRKVQISFRGSPSMKARLKAAAESLGIDDESTLIRMMVTECLPVYELRGQEIQAKREQER